MHATEMEVLTLPLIDITTAIAVFIFAAVFDRAISSEGVNR